jgi:membrane fusion protein, heavy metal efflux system
VRFVIAFAGWLIACLLLSACGDSSSSAVKTEVEQRSTAPGLPGKPATEGALPASSGPLVTLPAGSPQLSQIRVEPVPTREVPVEEVVAPARVGIDPNRTSRLLLPVPGRIAEVRVKLGDAVDRGQPVLALESPEADAAEAALGQARSTERQAVAALKKAEVDYARTNELYQHRAVAQKEVVAAENDVAQARATLDAARAGAVQAQRRLELLGLKPDDAQPLVQVRAPISGRVLEINVAPGEYRSDTASPLMTIADLSRVWMTSSVPESSIRLIHVGDPVSIALVAYPGETFRGRVARIADVLDPETRTVKVHVEVANPDGRFRPEMFGSIRHAGPLRQVPVIPVAALVQDSGRPTVLVERSPGTFERRTVTVAGRQSDFVPVLDGLRPGERVVVDGAYLLKDR